MIQIPWIDYSTEETVTTVIGILEANGYELSERSLSCCSEFTMVNSSSNEYLSVRIRNYGVTSNDEEEFAFLKRDGAKLYIDVRSCSQGKYQNNLILWNSRSLSDELASSLPIQYFWMFVENNIEREVFDINELLLHRYNKTREKDYVPIQKEELSPELIELLWNAKDRAVAWYKSLLTYQTFFEEVRLHRLTEEGAVSVLEAFLTSLLRLHGDSIVPLKVVVQEIITRYPGTCDRFCIQTNGRSHWNTFRWYSPKYLPGHIDSVDTGHIDDIDFFLANYTRNFTQWAYMMESVIDDLLGVALYDDWTRITHTCTDGPYDNRRFEQWSNMPNLTRI